MESDTQRIALGLRQRDVVVFETLVEQYQYRLIRYLISLLGRRDGVDDLVQETWLRVLERGKSYDGHSRFEPWLFRVARNIALDTMRKRPMFSLDSNEEDGVRSSPASGEAFPIHACGADTRCRAACRRSANSGARLSRSPRTAVSRRFVSTGDIRDRGSAGLHRSFQNLSRTRNAAAAV